MTQRHLQIRFARRMAEVGSRGMRKCRRNDAVWSNEKCKESKTGEFCDDEEGGEVVRFCGPVCGWTMIA